MTIGVVGHNCTAVCISGLGVETAGYVDGG